MFKANVQGKTDANKCKYRNITTQSSLLPLFVFTNRMKEGLKNNIKEKKLFRKVNHKFE